jgi:hypothetical protein
MKYAALIVESRTNEVAKGIINNIRHLPKSWDIIHYNPWTAYFHPVDDYNKLLTSLEFWKDLEKYERVLIFQHDSGLLKEGIESFLFYDYIGAPWKFQEHGGNGGLSLRNPKAMIEVIRTFSYGGQSLSGNEDVWFCNMLMSAKERFDKYNLAPREVCERFSCESIFQMNTLGYHAIDKYLTQDEVTKILTQYEKY